MNLTDEQLADAKSYLEQGKTPSIWMKDNNIEIGEGARPGRVVMLLRQKYGQETIQPLMVSMRSAMMVERIGLFSQNVISKAATVERCDSIIAKLQDSIVLAEAKKTEIQAG